MSIFAVGNIILKYMKRIEKILICIALEASVFMADASAEKVVILHTNDTHSQIDPDDKGRGGVMRRKALIDSVRRVEPNVLLVDAGDAVQGTPYFTLFGGEVEQNVLNRLGYDVQILGNHEFDNGLEALATNYRNARPTVVATNNLFDGTVMEGLTVPYVVKQTGGRRIGFLALNIDPEGMIDPNRCVGVRYVDGVEAANRTAAFLRDVAKVDAVVAVTHIGYTKDPNSKGYTDPMIAAATRGIDLIIGGHSHTDLRPGEERTRVADLDGDTVLVVQNSNAGKEMGKVVVTFGDDSIENIAWEKIVVDNRADYLGYDRDLEIYLAPRRSKVDSLMRVGIGRMSGEFDDPAMINYAADFVMERGRRLNGGRRPDLSVINKGGIRRNFSGDTLTVGSVMTIFPFDNRTVVVDISGRELLNAFDVMARQKGNGVSSNVRAVISEDATRCSEVTVDGRPIDPNRTYRVATIDYVADGGDNFQPFTTARRRAESDKVLYDDMIVAFTRGYMHGKTLKADSTSRWSREGDPDFKIKIR